MRMMTEEQETMQEGKDKKIKLRMTLAILCLMLLSIVELYLMINYSKSYLFLGVIAMAILCLVYFITDFSFQLQREKESFYEKEYESIYKAEKVFYVSMKQNFLEIEETLEKIRGNADVPAEDLIEAQKAIGKVMIQRNKENTVAMMHSNQELMKNMQNIESKLQETVNLIEALNAAKETLDNREVLEALKELRGDIRKETEDMVDNMEYRIGKVLSKSVSDYEVMLQDAIANVNSMQTDVSEGKAFKETEKMITPEELMERSSFILEKEDESSALETEAIKETPAPETKAAEETAVEETATEEAALEETGQEETQPEMTVAPEAKKTEESAADAEQVEEEKAKELETIADSGKMMSPEEIAALLGTGDEESETAKQEEAKPSVEEKAPAPDLSDPGHIMTPEEIANLLGSL